MFYYCNITDCPKHAFGCRVHLSPAIIQGTLMTEKYFPCGPFEPFKPKEYPGVWIDNKGTVLVPGPQGPLVPASANDVQHLDLPDVLELEKRSRERGGSGVYGQRADMAPGTLPDPLI
jgi:hypothetical protein